MGTYRDFISSIRSENKLLSSDQLITDRVIKAEADSGAKMLINQRLNERKLWATDTIFTTIPCLEMVQVPLSECCDYHNECTISRSKHKLPRINEGNYAYAIMGVYSINTGRRFDYLPPNRYVNYLKLNPTTKKTYYWIANGGYLYTTNPDLETVKFAAYFEEDVPSEIMYPDCECTTKINPDYCLNPLDKDFKFPGYLEEALKNMVTQRLLATFHNLPQDKTSNNLDETSK